MELKLSEELRAKLKQYGQTKEKPDELLAQLEKSELLSPDFPRRSGMSHAEVGGGAAYRRVNTADAALGSIVAVGDIGRHAIEALGKARHEPALPLLIRLWSTCPVEGVWRAAGDALLAIGTPEALAALSANLDEYDPDGRIRGSPSSPSSVLIQQAPMTGSSAISTRKVWQSPGARRYLSELSRHSARPEKTPTAR